MPQTVRSRLAEFTSCPTFVGLTSSVTQLAPHAAFFLADKTHSAGRAHRRFYIGRPTLCRYALRFSKCSRNTLGTTTLGTCRRRFLSPRAKTARSGTDFGNFSRRTLRTIFLSFARFESTRTTGKTRERYIFVRVVPCSTFTSAAIVVGTGKRGAHNVRGIVQHR